MRQRLCLDLRYNGKTLLPWLQLIIISAEKNGDDLVNTFVDTSDPISSLSNIVMRHPNNVVSSSHKRPKRRLLEVILRWLFKSEIDMKHSFCLQVVFDMPWWLYLCEASLSQCSLLEHFRRRHTMWEAGAWRWDKDLWSWSLPSTSAAILRGIDPITRHPWDQLQHRTEALWCLWAEGLLHLVRSATIASCGRAADTQQRRQVVTAQQP